MAKTTQNSTNLAKCRILESKTSNKTRKTQISKLQHKIKIHPFPSRSRKRPALKKERSPAAVDGEKRRPYIEMEGGSSTEEARKIMVVADSSRESAGALQYALSHAVMEKDTLILLHVALKKNPFGALFKNPMSPGVARLGGIGSYSASSVAEQGGGGGGGGEVDFLDGMKRACVAAKPKVKVVVEKVEMAEGKDKAALIVAHSAACKVDLLIIAQKRTTLSKSLLGSRRGLSFKVFDTADYVIENSKCTSVAVQKKGNGGYLLNSKLHKNFWLLA